MAKSKDRYTPEQFVAEFLRAMDRAPVIGAMIAEDGRDKALARTRLETVANRLRISLEPSKLGDVKGETFDTLTNLVVALHEKLDLVEVMATCGDIPEGAYRETVFLGNLQGLDRRQLDLVARFACRQASGLELAEIAAGFGPFRGISSGFAVEEIRDLKTLIVLLLFELFLAGVLPFEVVLILAGALEIADRALEPKRIDPFTKPGFTTKSVIPLAKGTTATFDVGPDEGLSVELADGSPTTIGTPSVTVSGAADAPLSLNKDNKGPTRFVRGPRKVTVRVNDVGLMLSDATVCIRRRQAS